MTDLAAEGRACVFCGTVGNLTKEHVFGAWIGRLGLDSTPAQHRTGFLNRLGRDLGVSAPYTRTVRDVCATCNNGWMGDVEATAQQVLTPFILGEPGTLPLDRQGAVAMWAQKTALTAMLLSREADRDDGYGLPASEYRALYEERGTAQPLPASSLWIGRYVGTRQSLTWVTPFVVQLNGLPEPTLPHGYIETIAVGALVVQGVRFTSPAMDLELMTRQGMPRLWPPNAPIGWPAGSDISDDDLLGFVAGKDLVVLNDGVRIVPWGPAANLPESVEVGDTIRLPALCGKHAVYYPRTLALEGLRGRSHAFMTTCACGEAYLVHTERDGAHVRMSGPAEAIAKAYEDLPGEEFIIEGAAGEFICKRLNAAPK